MGRSFHISKEQNEALQAKNLNIVQKNIVKKVTSPTQQPNLSLCCPTCQNWLESTREMCRASFHGRNISPQEWRPCFQDVLLASLSPPRCLWPVFPACSIVPLLTSENVLPTCLFHRSAPHPTPTPVNLIWHLLHGVSSGPSLYFAWPSYFDDVGFLSHLQIGLNCTPGINTASIYLF